MKCFVIAMESEAKPVLAAMKIKKRYKNCERQIYMGKLYGKSVAVVVCGVGKVNAACGTQYAIDRLGADVIINVGVAGGLHGGVEKYRMYAAEAAVQYDFDLTQLNGTAIGTLDEYRDNYINLNTCPAFPHKKVGTGDRFNDSPADHDLLISLGADIRDMELGAIAQACKHARVKCYAYKVISDIYGSGSTTEQFKESLDMCFKTLSFELEKIVKESV